MAPSALIDVDTLGPGRRADDLACLLAHLLTLPTLDADGYAEVPRLPKRCGPAQLSPPMLQTWEHGPPGCCSLCCPPPRLRSEVQLGWTWLKEVFMNVTNTTLLLAHFLLVDSCLHVVNMSALNT